MAKRAIDVVGAASGLVLFAPLLVGVALAVRVLLGCPILFRQLRPGYLERPFTIYKFRTMREAADRFGRQLPDGERLLPLGTFLRKTSLDELPELWNVLRGDMSLVGPRPLLMEYLPRYTAEQHQRHLIRPGITGLAQISGRQDIAFSRRIELDTWYVHNWSFRLDLSILAKTLIHVIAGSGVRSGQNVSDVDDLSAPNKSSNVTSPFNNITS